MFESYYLILGVDRHSSVGQIKHAYRRIAKRLQPDIPCVSPDAERFLEVQEAYETLVDAEKRQRYDSELTRQNQSGRIHRYAE